MPYRPEIFVEGKWTPNGLRFATEAEALGAANDTYRRWLLAEGARAAPCDEPVNYAWRDGALVRLNPDGSDAAPPVVLPDRVTL